ncbi:MAG: hypothetical protein IJJ33_12320 [Victivallales bacterium]|nr:hypothetical protein [Victivallales bacterium]
MDRPIHESRRWLLPFFLWAALALADSVLPEGGFLSRWLWYPEKAQNHTTRYFRKVLDVPGEAAEGELVLLVDDSGEPLLNGTKLRQLPLEQKERTLLSRRYSLTSALHPGKNVLAIAVTNGLSDAGFILTGWFRLTTGEVVPIVSDLSWRCAQKPTEGWLKPNFDDSGWQSPKDQGDCMTQPWYGLSNAADQFMTAAERQEYLTRKAKAVDISFLDTQRQLQVTLATKGEMTGLLVDGKPTAPILYIFGNPWLPGVEEGIQRLSNQGIHWFEISVGLTKMMKPDECYDFASIDENIRHVLALDNQAMLNLRLRFERSPKWWEASHPEALVQYCSSSTYESEQAYRFRTASMASEAWRAEMEKTIRGFLRYAKGQPWAKRVVGLRLGYGVYGEWHYYGMERDMPDCGQAMTLVFRKHLARKYGDDQSLRRAWHRPDAELSTAQVPGTAARMGRGLYLREPCTDQIVLDYYECHSQVVAETLLRLARAAKEEMPTALVGAYYGYTFGMGYGPEAQTADLERVLSSPNIDFLSAPLVYLTQRRIGGDGLVRTIPAVFRRHGKLMLVEDDTRTHLAQPPHYQDAKTPLESTALLRRNLANAFLSGGGIQLLEFGSSRQKPNWWCTPELLDTLDKAREVWRTMFDSPRKSAQEIAVVFEPSELWRHGYPKAPVHWSTSATDLTLDALHRSGRVFDLLTTRDFLASSHPYKAVVFLNLYTLDAEARRRLRQRLETPAIRQVIWFYAPGLVAEDGFSAEAMQELTGLRLAFDLNGGTALVYLDAENAIGYRPGGKELKIAPLVYADDAEAQVLGKYEDGRAGLVRKQLSNGRAVIFSGVHILEPRLWAELFAASGIHGHCESGPVILASRDTLLCHVARMGRYSLALPREASCVTELFERQIIGNGGSEITLESNGPHTWLLNIQ